jgi:hypothetical protein
VGRFTAASDQPTDVQESRLGFHLKTPPLARADPSRRVDACRTDRGADPRGSTSSVRDGSGGRKGRDRRRPDRQGHAEGADPTHYAASDPKTWRGSSRTFFIWSADEIDAGPINNWADKEMRTRLTAYGRTAGRTMVCACVLHGVSSSWSWASRSPTAAMRSQPWGSRRGWWPAALEALATTAVRAGPHLCPA